MKPILLIGHRGTRKGYDENTIGAFRKAIEYGADLIEMDIHITKDNKIIVIHDETLDRTTNGRGNVNAITYKEIEQYRTLKNYEKIPKLRDVIEHLKNNVKFIIELKNPSLVQSVMELLKGFSQINNFFLSSRDIQVLKDIKDNNNNIPVCYNITKAKEFTLNDYMNSENEKDLPLKFDMINLRSILINKNFIKKCQDLKIKTIAWDFIKYKNPIRIQRNLIKKGIDCIMFDDYRNIRIIIGWLNKS
ncbi:MAG: hypothetical protein EU550_00475 [Promethearchaeota archaeon]|nr:MAG: hypothetical protein EU550_00475 [Candidatus Lokiarchaeota archaeon]